MGLVQVVAGDHLQESSRLRGKDRGRDGQAGDGSRRVARRSEVMEPDCPAASAGVVPGSSARADRRLA